MEKKTWTVSTVDGEYEVTAENFHVDEEIGFVIFSNSLPTKGKARNWKSHWFRADTYIEYEYDSTTTERVACFPRSRVKAILLKEE